MVRSEHGCTVDIHGDGEMVMQTSQICRAKPLVGVGNIVSEPISMGRLFGYKVVGQRLACTVQKRRVNADSNRHDLVKEHTLLQSALYRNLNQGEGCRKHVRAGTTDLRH